MDDFGLSEKEMHLIRTAFSAYPLVKKVKIFGSRVLGTFKYNSDIDLCVYGGKLKLRDLAEILGFLEALPLPYKFDLVDYDSLKDTGLREHIDTFGQEFYVQKNPNLMR